MHSIRVRVFVINNTSRNLQNKQKTKPTQPCVALFLHPRSDVYTRQASSPPQPTPHKTTPLSITACRTPTNVPRLAVRIGSLKTHKRNACSCPSTSTSTATSSRAAMTPICTCCVGRARPSLHNITRVFTTINTIRFAA